MSLKKYLILMTTTTFVCWLAWLIVLFYINPEEAGLVGFTLFYFSLFFALVGTFSLLGFFIRVWFTKDMVIFRFLGIATRQAFWLAILLVAALFMQSANFFHWWSIGLVILLLLLLEFFFLSRKVVRR